MNYTAEQIKIAKTCGALNYDFARTAMLINASKYDAVLEDLRDDTELSREYDAGSIEAQFAIDNKLFELARGGDVKAIELFNQMRDENKFAGEGG